MKPPKSESYENVLIEIFHNAEYHYCFRYCLRGQAIMSQFEYKSDYDAIEAARLEIDKLLNL